MNQNTIKKPLMVCTQARGGMRSVVEAYERDGVFERWQFQWLWTHCEGPALKKLTKGLSAYFNMLNLLIRAKVSFLHLHSAMRGSFWRKSFFMMTARLFGVPCIFHLHGSEMKTFYNGLPAIGQWLVKCSLEKADAVIVLSQSWQDFIFKAAPKAKIHIINNYVSLPQLDVKNANSNATFDVLFLGILGHRKGIYDLLASWTEVLAAVPNARLLIGGNGEVEQATAMAEKLGISDSVVFLGWVDQHQKAELLSTADSFVLPSYNEGLPMSVLEAMSYKVPVVTTNVGGIPELIDNDINGLMIEPGDQAALSNALIKLGGDLGFRTAIANTGFNTIEASFSDKVILPKLEKIYQNIN